MVSQSQKLFFFLSSTFFFSQFNFSLFAEPLPIGRQQAETYLTRLSATLVDSLTDVMDNLNRVVIKNDDDHDARLRALDAEMAFTEAALRDTTQQLDSVCLFFVLGQLCHICIGDH
jgi:hypothetical protein